MELYLGTIVIWPVTWVPEGFQICDGTLLSVGQNQALFSLIGNVFGGDGTSTFAVPDLRGRVPVGDGVAKTGTKYVFNQSGGLETIPVIMQLSSNTPIGVGTGTVTGSLSIDASQIPAHTHGLAGFSVPVSIPANASGGNTDTPGTTAVLAKGTVVGGPVNTTAKSYSTAAANTNLLPFNVNVPASNTLSGGGGNPIKLSLPVNVSVRTGENGLIMATETSLMQPYLVLKYIMCISGYYPPRP